MTTENIPVALREKLDKSKGKTFPFNNAVVTIKDWAYNNNEKKFNIITSNGIFAKPFEKMEPWIDRILSPATPQQNPQPSNEVSVPTPATPTQTLSLNGTRELPSVIVDFLKIQNSNAAMMGQQLDNLLDKVVSSPDFVEQAKQGREIIKTKLDVITAQAKMISEFLPMIKEQTAQQKAKEDEPTPGNTTTEH